MHFCICDDSLQDYKHLKEMLQSYCAQNMLSVEVDWYSGAQALLKNFCQGKYQIIFLDIYMPGMTGMQAAQVIRESDTECMIVFATTSEDHALESYGVYAAGYLLKPYTKEQLSETLDWCIENMPTLAQTIEIFSERERISVPVRELIYIEIYGRESVFHTTGKIYTANRTLVELEKELPGDFIRCHRSYLVNMNHVRRVVQNSFVLKNGERIPMSTEIGLKAKQRYFDWLFQRTWERR